MKTTKQAGHAYMLASECRQYLTWGVTVKRTPAGAIERAKRKVLGAYGKEIEFEVSFLVPVYDVFLVRTMWFFASDYRDHQKLQPCLSPYETPIGRYEGVKGDLLEKIHNLEFEVANLRQQMGAQA